MTAILQLYTEIKHAYSIHDYQKDSKNKAIPAQALTGPEGSGKLKLQDFKTIGT